MKFRRDQAQYMSDAREEGLEKGREEGLAEGRKEGLKEGLKEGYEESVKLTAQNMKKDGISPELIQKYTGLSLEEIGAL